MQAFSERRPAEISVEGRDLSHVFPRLRNNFLETFEGRTIPRVTGCDDIRLLAAMRMLIAFLELERITHQLAVSALLKDDDN